jgi:hypothetical protein
MTEEDTAQRARAEAAAAQDPVVDAAAVLSCEAPSAPDLVESQLAVVPLSVRTMLFIR